ncbi:MAG: aspartate/glutamate racemase family protein [Anaerolineales bacterium]|nr:aspartate/glutamate racemase family protein [Anaerolineales bacterium]
MKTIGLIGGMSWESSSVYYRIINEEIRERLGGFHSAKCVMVSVDFAEIEAYQRAGDWDQAAEAMIAAARQVEAAGADMLLICTNTMHKLAPEVKQAVKLPLLHIADATASAVKEAGIRKVGLLGTRFTMEEPFYTSRLQENGLEVLVPEEADRKEVDRIIFEELVQGEIRLPSKAKYIDVMSGLVQAGAGGIILGCTEIGLLVSSGDCDVPVFDTTLVHAHAGVDAALAD